MSERPAALLDRGADGPEPDGPVPPDRPRSRITRRTVSARRLVGLLLVLGPLAWALTRVSPGDRGIVNTGGLRLLDDLLGAALRPRLDAEFLTIVWDATVITVVFATLGTLGALGLGLVGGAVLSDVAWRTRLPWPVRALRTALRGVLVAVRSIHELIWALLFVSVLGLDPLVAVLAIAVPFGAQTAKVFAETLDAVPPGPAAALRSAGVPSLPAALYAVLPTAFPMLLSYSFYRFECAIRSAVLLGVAGVGGLGQELVVTLRSRNWDEVWTLVLAVLLLSALVDAWSARVREDVSVRSCSDWSGGAQSRADGGPGEEPAEPPLLGRARHGRWARWTGWAIVPLGLLAWWSSGVSLAGLLSERTADLTVGLAADMWPPEPPPGGWAVVVTATLDTVAMAVLGMAVAVVITLLVGPFATRVRRGAGIGSGAGGGARWLRRPARALVGQLARIVLLVLRSVPPTVWAVVALLVLYPGVLPGALALGLYTGGILGRLVSEAWESVGVRPRDALVAAGVRPGIATAAAVVPPSAHHLLAYTLYRFEICVRDTAVVGVVGAVGLGRLLAENFAVFRFPAVSALLIASFLVSLAAELLGRRLRAALRP